MQERIMQPEVKRKAIPARLITAAINAYVGGEKAMHIEARLNLKNPTLFYHLHARGIPLQGRDRRIACKGCERRVCNQRKKFCSAACRTEHQKRLARAADIMPKCNACGAEMWKSQRLYCSVECKEASKKKLLLAQLKRYAQMREDYYPVKSIIAELGISRPRAVKLRDLWLAGRSA